nr:hypothetical protein [Flavobacterium faecale]
MGKKHQSPLREATVHNTYVGSWGLRQGKWLYINKPTGEVTKMPESFKKLKGYTDFKTKGLLFDMDKDPEQRVNLYEQFPEKIKEMDALIQKYRDQGYSVIK